MEHPVHPFESRFEISPFADVPAQLLDCLREVFRPSPGMDAGLKAVEDAHLVAALDEQVDRVGADESGASRNQDPAHGKLVIRGERRDWKGGDTRVGTQPLKSL